MKTEKIASFRFLGVLLLFMLLFSELVPLLKVIYRGMREPFLSGDYCELTIDGPVNWTGYSRKCGGKKHISLCG